MTKPFFTRGGPCTPLTIVARLRGPFAPRRFAPLSLPLGLVLFLATNAWAQLASQTALVGTVTDRDGLVVPGAQVVAVNVGTKDTYEATTNAEGYYNTSAPARMRSPSRSPGFRRSRRPASKWRTTRSFARMPSCRSASWPNR